MGLFALILLGKHRIIVENEQKVLTKRLWCAIMVLYPILL